jgi:hypothetical protein
MYVFWFVFVSWLDESIYLARIIVGLKILLGNRREPGTDGTPELSCRSLGQVAATVFLRAEPDGLDRIRGTTTSNPPIMPEKCVDI